VNRYHFQKIARARLRDAKALLATKRWACAYYVCGYAVECGLKACLLKHLGESEAVFGEVGYLKKLADCWTHDLVQLVKLAGLEADFGATRGANPALASFWGTVKEWTETSRYEERSRFDAEQLYEAVNNKPNGVIRWIQLRW
jgi:hypothetical protein